MHIRALYESVTAQIIADLEAGVCPWTKPWKASGGGIMPHNAATKRSYNGINIPILWHAQSTRGYPTASWMTFKQAQALEATVRGGEKGTHIVFTKQLTVKDAEGEEDKKVGMLKAYSVFNVAQIDGLPEEPSQEPLKVVDGRVADFIKATKAEIQHGGDRACYVPSKDFVLLPNPVAFKTYEHYQATVLHELTHWSGHKGRLDRDLDNRFGTKAYAAEELIAELGAAFLCAHLGIKGELKHSEYIATWIDLLKGDDRAIFTASSKASQAADYLRQFSEPVQQDEAA
jgi:antirestriction protein ArdC